MRRARPRRAEPEQRAAKEEVAKLALAALKRIGVMDPPHPLSISDVLDAFYVCNWIAFAQFLASSASSKSRIRLHQDIVARFGNFIDPPKDAQNTVGGVDWWHLFISVHQAELLIRRVKNKWSGTKDHCDSWLAAMPAEGEICLGFVGQTSTTPAKCFAATVSMARSKKPPGMLSTLVLSEIFHLLDHEDMEKFIFHLPLGQASDPTTRDYVEILAIALLGPDMNTLLGGVVPRLTPIPRVGNFLVNQEDLFPSCEDFSTR